jgi:hypothetical protein
MDISKYLQQIDSPKTPILSISHTSLMITKMVLKTIEQQMHCWDACMLFNTKHKVGLTVCMLQTNYQFNNQN